MLIKIFLFLFALSAFAEGHEVVHVTGSCRIFNYAGKVSANFPGRHCIFLDDGRLISAANVSIRGFKSGGEIEWEYPINGQYAFINESPDKNHVLLLTVPRDIHPSKPIPFLLTVLDTHGVIVAHREMDFKLGIVDLPRAPVMMSEIPELNIPSPAPWMKKGNILLNVRERGTLVFSSDLKTLVHTIKIPTTKWEMVNDLQVTPRGTLLYLNPMAKESSMDAPASTVEEYDPVTEKIIFRYPNIPNGSFFLPFGSVEEIENGILQVNHPMSGVYLISKKENRILRYMTETHYDKRGIIPHELLRTRKLDAFFRNFNF